MSACAELATRLELITRPTDAEVMVPEEVLSMWALSVAAKAASTVASPATVSAVLRIRARALSGSCVPSLFSSLLTVRSDSLGVFQPMLL